ncbi:MAG: hypothetical protein JNM99_03685 [Verrucomicrobiaceae bacterium]|nr:hypothetical protein [Verrucomicrobiaceae bacterium]
MKLKTITRSILGSAAACLALSVSTAKADIPEAADKAFEMAEKYAGMGYYMAPSKEGKAGHGVTLEFEIPVNRGLDYVFILAGDKYAKDVDLYIESENGNTIVKDTRATSNGLAGVRWRSDYNGVVNVVIHFARAVDRCGWAAVAGRRGTPAVTDNRGDIDARAPGNAERIGNETSGGKDAVEGSR